MSELARVTAKYLPINHKEVNLAMMVKSIRAQYFTPVETAVKGGYNYTLC